MRTNPGGGLAPEEVVGRDALIADLWDKLERHSVMMTAKRRMGRTSRPSRVGTAHPLNSITK
jgi:hypothetical protein